MNEVGSLHQNKIESLLPDKKLEIKAQSVHQQEDVVLNHTVGKKNPRFNDFLRLALSLALRC